MGEYTREPYQSLDPRSITIKLITNHEAVLRWMVRLVAWLVGWSVGRRDVCRATRAGTCMRMVRGKAIEKLGGRGERTNDVLSGRGERTNDVLLRGACGLAKTSGLPIIPGPYQPNQARC
jgi:hypothetical protein